MHLGSLGAGGRKEHFTRIKHRERLGTVCSQLACGGVRGSVDIRSMNTGELPDFRDFLNREMKSRMRRNPGYSLRAFARDIEMPVSKLSEVLRGLRRLSPQTANRVAANLDLSVAEKTLFLNLVIANQNRSTTAKLEAEKNLASLAQGAEYGELDLERFKIISDWYHLAILEMTEVQGFESNASWIAGRLGIPTATASEAIERLLSFGLLEKTDGGKLRQTQINLATPTGIPSREIREHHSQILMKAEEALRDTEISERDFSAITVAFDPDEMPEVRDALKKLRRKLSEKIQDRAAKTRVYCLAIQFFPLDRIKNKKGKSK